MLRVLATWDPEALPAPHDATRSIEDDAALGILPGANARSWFSGAWDQRPEFVATEQDVEDDDGYIRETARGIELRRHPEAVLRDSPRLWDVVAMWRSGVERELTREQYAHLPNFEVECWMTLVSASNREMERRIKRGGREEDATT